MRRTLTLGTTFVVLATATLGLATTTLGATPQGTQSAQLQVSAHVVRNCQIMVSALDFGNYDAIVANTTQPLDADTPVGVVCSKGTVAKIGIDAGANAQGSTRRMAGGGDYLTYELYTDAARSNVWGTGAQARAVAPSFHTLNIVTLYGRIPANQDVASADYADTATVTISF